MVFTYGCVVDDQHWIWMRRHFLFREKARESVYVCRRERPSDTPKALTKDLCACVCVQGVTMMACRRNLKKEKRARNEACARQYRKPPQRSASGPLGLGFFRV